MSAVVAQKDNENLYVFDEIVIYSSNTDEMADEIGVVIGRQLYFVSRPCRHSGKTSAGGKTDFTILQNYGFRVRARTHHPYIRDRINAVNSRLQSGTGERHLFFTLNCRRTIESVEKISYKGRYIRCGQDKRVRSPLFCWWSASRDRERNLKISKIDPKGMIEQSMGSG